MNQPEPVLDPMKNATAFAQPSNTSKAVPRVASPAVKFDPTAASCDKAARDYLEEHGYCVFERVLSTDECDDACCGL